jgi:hypothetical protein
MAKITLPDIAAAFASTAALNDRFGKIEDALNGEVLYRANPVGEPNEMSNNLDMNTKQILNLPAPVDPTDPVRLKDIEGFTALPTLEVTPQSVQVFTSAEFVVGVGKTTLTVDTDSLVNFLAINGALQIPTTDYTKSGDVVTIDKELLPADVVVIVSGNGAGLQVDAEDVTYTAPFTGSVQSDAQTKLSERVSVKDFGAVGDGVADDTAAIKAAIAYIDSIGGGIVYAPRGVYNFNQTLELTAIGTHLEGDTMNSTIFNITANVDGIRLLANYQGLKGFKLTQSTTHTLNGIEVGSASNSSGRSILSELWVEGMGKNGLTITNGNLGTLENIVAISNAQYGVFFDNVTPNNNAYTGVGFIDCRNNGSHGVFLQAGAGGIADANSSRSHHFALIVSQSNGGDGLRVETSKNHIIVYGESSGGFDINLESQSATNFVMATNAGPTQNIGDANALIREVNGQLIWEGGIRFDEEGGWVIDGGSNIGSLSLTHQAANRFDMFADDSGTGQTLRFKNVANLADPDSDTPLYPLYLDLDGGSIISDRIILTVDSTTPDVTLGSWFLFNNSPTNVTYFSGGVNGQKIDVMSNNANTTLVHSATTTGLSLKSGANETMAKYEGKSFRRAGNNWWIEV